jgi:hypothetical protein
VSGLDPRAAPDQPTQDTPGASRGTTLIAALTIMWMLLVVVDAGWPLNLLELAYLLVVPGLAVTRAAGLRTSPASMSLAVALSVGIAGVAFGLLVTIELPSELLLRAILVAVTIGALAIDEYVTSTRPGVALETMARPSADGAPGHHQI